MSYKKKSTPDIRDVAIAAGVSVSTVSRVLNGYANVSESADQRVTAAILATGYRPNAIARGLRQNTTKTLALVVNNMLNPMYPVLAQGIESVAKARGFHLHLCNSGANPEQEEDYLKSLWERRIDGLVISPTGSNQSFLRAFLRAGTPVVQVDRISDGLEADAVLTDNRDTARRLVTHLIDRGARRIAVMVGNLAATTAWERLTGYFDALQAHEIEVDPGYIFVGSFTEDFGRGSMEALVTREVRPDAVFFGNNLLAQGGVRVLHHAGVRIPQDIAVAMFDDPDWADLHSPPITAVRQPAYELGRTAAEVVFNRLESGDFSRPIRRVLENTLMVRDST